ncbi:TIM barrel protein [soil metagenome]
MQTRRTALRWLAAGSGLAALSVKTQAAEPLIKNGKIKQSIVHWCFERGAKWKLADTVKAALELGCVSVEGVKTEDWEVLKQNNLKCAYVGAHGFVKGMNNPVFWDANLQAMHDRIDKCAEYGNPNVLSFTGFTDTTAQGGSVISLEQGKKNCIEAYKKIIPYAEQKGVTIIMEHLNSRDSADMKGHPGYQGDNVDYCAEIIRGVGSPSMKLLFDIYHVQIMHGDVIRRIEENKDIIGHVHTAGNPGRAEIGKDQEINYPPIIKKLIDVGYTGYLGHEFIPTIDPMVGLREAVTLCDVA